MKTNTHYFTDALIRPTLNEIEPLSASDSKVGGTSKPQRERGSYFVFEDDISYHLQRSTSESAIERNLGRLPTDEEIEASKEHIAYSVNDCFCAECESRFTRIENAFTNNILAKFRDSETAPQLLEGEKQITKRFFCLQLWRASVCGEPIQLAPEVAENLRQMIFGGNWEQLDKHGFTLTHYHTLDKKYSENIISVIDSYVIISDFKIKFNENLSDGFSIIKKSDEERREQIESVLKRKIAKFIALFTQALSEKGESIDGRKTGLFLQYMEGKANFGIHDINYFIYNVLPLQLCLPPS